MEKTYSQIIEKTPKNDIKNQRKIIWGIFVLFWIIAIFRITIIGQFLDDCLFRFVFGWARHLVYLIVFFGITAYLLKINFKTNYLTKKKIISFFWFFSILLWICGLTGLIILVANKSSDNNVLNYSNYLIDKQFIPYLNNWKENSIFGIESFEWEDLFKWNKPFFNKYEGGGFLGFLIASISCYFYFIGAFLLIIFTIFLLCSYISTNYPFFYFFGDQKKKRIIWINLNQKQRFRHISRTMYKIKNEDFTMELPTSQKIIDQEINNERQSKKLTNSQELHQLIIDKNKNEKIQKTSWITEEENINVHDKNEKIGVNLSILPDANEPIYYEDEENKKDGKNTNFEDKAFAETTELPPIELWPYIKSGNEEKEQANLKRAEDKKKKLEDILFQHKVKAKIVNFYVGPNVTKYELVLEKGTKVNTLLDIKKEIELGLAEKNVRIDTPILGKNSLGIEIPNSFSTIVGWREAITDLRNDSITIKLPIGKNIFGKTCLLEMEGLPHLLIAGSTGGGKSVCLITLIMAMIYQKTPTDLKLLLIDPKRVELSVFKNIPHLAGPIITNTKLTPLVFVKVLQEIEKRYKKFEDNGFKNIDSFNRANPQNRMPKLVVVIDELADLILVYHKEVEDKIVRITQIGRAVGIHLIVATQRPSNDIITGLIKTNIPGRIAFSVTNQFDSRTILDKKGAENLVGRGDLLYLDPKTNNLIRAQGFYVNESEIEIMTDFWQNKNWKNYYWDEFINLNEEQINNNQRNVNANFNDEMYEEIKVWVKQQKTITISKLQRQFGIGYNRSARICEKLENENVVSAPGVNHIREVLGKII